MINKMLLKVNIVFFQLFIDFSCGGGWVLRMKYMLTQLLTKFELKLKLKLSLARFY